MATNTVAADSQPRPPLLHGEKLLGPATAGHTADLELRIPPTTEGPKRTETARGSLWLTDQRIIFLADSTPSSSAQSYDKPPSLTSLIIPYILLIASDFKLPILSANYLLLTFLPDFSSGSSPNLPRIGRGAHIEAKFMPVGDSAWHGLWKRIEGERLRAREKQKEDEILPVYQAQSSDRTITPPGT